MKMAARSVCFRKMKSFYVTLALCAAPWLLMPAAQSQAQMAPLRISKAPAEPLPDAQQLLDNLWAPYETAQTFRGNFGISIKAENNAIAEIGLETKFRYDDKDILQRQFSRMKIVGRAKPKQQQTILFVDDGQNQKIVLVEQKVWWNVEKRDNAAALFSMVKPLVDQVVQALENDDNFTPVVSRSKLMGRPTYLLRSKKNEDFRASIDAETRALRALEVKNTIVIVARPPVFDAPFNAPIADSEFEWSAPVDYRQVAPGEVMPPASLGITIPGTAATPTG